MAEADEFIFRFTTEADLPTIVALLADDEIGKDREAATPSFMDAYRAAWRAMEAEPFNRLLVVAHGARIVGVLQLTLIAGLTRGGMKRAQIEGVRVDRAYRGRGVGRRLLTESVELARSQACGLIQLTTDKRRPDAKRFYESMGFSATHEGMKIAL